MLGNCLKPGLGEEEAQMEPHNLELLHLQPCCEDSVIHSFNMLLPSFACTPGTVLQGAG